MTIKSIPFAKNSVHVEWRIILPDDAEYEIEVGVRAAESSYIFSGMCLSASTPAKMIADVCHQYIREVMPFAHVSIGDLVELRSIMDKHDGDGFPFRALLEAGWHFPQTKSAA